MPQDLLLVSNIERFAIHDGPGIRTTVFLKGCPLNCPWCANPEARKAGRVLMYQESKCVGCGSCWKTAPDCFSAQNGKCAPRWEQLDDPTAAESAVSVCLGGALTINGQWMTGDEVFSLVMRDAPYYRDTDGGVTFSGGEPLMHMRELTPILERFGKAGIHRAAETCGAVSSSQIEAAAEHFDLFLFDIKTANECRFRAAVGGDLEQVLENLRYLAAFFPERIVIRIPVIPGFNHTEKDMEAIFSLIAGLYLNRVDLLPYHTLGAAKYSQSGEVYPYEGHKALHENDLKKYADLGRAFGFSVKIGG